MIAEAIGRGISVTKWAIDYIVDELPEWEETSVYGADLAMHLTERPNVDGMYESDSWGFLKEHLDDAAIEFDYEKQEFGEVTNPFDDPEGFVVRMLINTVDAVLARVPLVDERWNECVKWTGDDIRNIIDWLTKDEDEEEDEQ
jgi:hypothetical protein